MIFDERSTDDIGCSVGELEKTLSTILLIFFKKATS